MRLYIQAILAGIFFSLCGSLACGGPTPPPDNPDKDVAKDTDKDDARDAANPSEQTAGQTAGKSAGKSDGPPATRRTDVVDTVHGVQITDPYRWLEDVKKPEVGTWLDAQDTYARNALAARPERAALVDRFKELYYLDSVTPPYHRAGRYFYSRRHKDKEKRVVYWKKGEKGAERVLFDPNGWSDDGAVSLKGYSISWDGAKVAYKKSENNADESTMYIRDIATGKDSKIDVIPHARYASASWTPDNKGFYYEWLPSPDSVPVADRPGFTEVRYHRLGTDPTQDEIIFPALHDSKLFLGGGVSRDGRWLMIYLRHGWNRTEIYVKDLKKKRRKRAPAPRAQAEVEAMTTAERATYYAGQFGFTPMVVGVDASFFPYWWKGYFYVYSNHEAPNFRLYKIKPKDIGKLKKWKTLVAESEAKMEFPQVVGNHLVIPYLRNAASEVEIRNLRGKLVRKVQLPGIGTTRGMLGNPDEDKAYFGFSSFTSPSQIFETSIKSGKTRLWYKQELPIDTSKMTAEQVWYQSKDGTKVSMFIIHRTDMDKNGKNPTLLYGYGGFNISMTPRFISTAAVWLEKGGIYAIPNLRGGGEYGESWHKAGMLDKKQNVFDDYIAAAEYLIKEGYTSKDKLAIYGGSNGGLLVGAAMTQRPDLYRAVVCSVPLLDMVRYHLFGSGKTWIPEYGTAEKPEQFKFIHAYSPYHRVEKDTAYPSLLMLAADSDDRVDPMHARKFTAAVQWATSSQDRPVLMRVERNAGHGGADMVKKSVERSADLTAYLMWQLGM